ncbi:hypothetical protein HZC00_02505 [Candidatus Kaiserbacteria bacterium]|nr:hypothetical protein [Candidatus Kaiserbacteria bacterium]
MNPHVRKAAIVVGAITLFLLAAVFATFEYLSHRSGNGNYPFLVYPPHGLVIGHPYRLLGPITVCHEYSDLFDIEDKMYAIIKTHPIATENQISGLFEEAALSLGCQQATTGTFTIRHFHGWSAVTHQMVRWRTGLSLSEFPEEGFWWTLVFENNKGPTTYED